MGCGGIGGVVAAHLAELGLPVAAVSRNREVVEAVRSQGFRLVGEGGRRNVPGQVHATVPAEAGPFDWVLLATQPTDVESAARQAAPYLSPRARVVCFQNGLCEERVAQILGPEVPVIGGIVAWGATMVEPGVFDRTSSGGFSIGRLDGEADPALAQLATWLEAIGPVQQTGNLTGARWSKLALNCTTSALSTLSGERLGTLVRERYIRRLALEVMSEVVEVARRARVRLEKVAGTLDLEWIALSEEERRQRGSLALASKHAMLLAVGMRYRRLRSSMLRAIERGSAPPIDFLNGEIVARAKRLEVPVPLNAAICDAVWRISRRELVPGRAVLAELFAQSRGAGSSPAL
ncbi:MAG: ketopantoate reductase family protein [Deltaproteobacteria bacterium]|nr:ketopantoate reductase family protein [Deltaproteobacteria bacterium]